ncbi:MAG: MoxR family ATPase [Planctomycetes bacterium]|nr:MoxR family ATPase [Planctomycetota bacterium]
MNQATEAPGQVNREQFEALTGRIAAVRREVGKVIVGQTDIVEQVLLCILAGGHGLMMGVPGLAKTLLVSTLARVLHLSFKRIQFTPDLMPSDITGSDILEEQADGTRRFVFLQGPLFANMVLADEINRTPPKTQAALLEAMQEHRVTVGRSTYPLKEPFFVLATQNPIEQEGTYPLPEAQQDRFMFFLHVRYPEVDEEVEVMNRTTSRRAVSLEPQMSGDDILQVQHLVREVLIAEHVTRYAVDLVRASRTDRGQEGDSAIPEFVRRYLQWGAGPRAAQYLILGAKGRALLQGHTHASVEDVDAVAYPVLRHRLIVNFAAEAEGVDSGEIIRQLLEHVKSRPR